jgi:hypothetical protein
LSVSGGFTYNDARVRNWFTPVGSTPTVKNGTALPLAPKYKGSASIEYTIPVGRLELAPNLTFSYQDESFADLNEPVALRIPGYTTSDLIITLRDACDVLAPVQGEVEDRPRQDLRQRHRQHDG